MPYNYYRIYNLNGKVEFALPCCVMESQNNIDFEVVRKSNITFPLSEAVNKTGKYSLVTNSGVFFDFDNGVRFFVDHNAEVIHASEESTGQLMENYFLGPVMATLCYQRGDLVLHGSCVETAGRGVVFLGASSAGKSTIAAGLMKDKWTMITDDHVVVRDLADPTVQRSGIQRMKLGGEVLTTLGYNSEQYCKIPGKDKRSFCINTFGSGEAPVPLSQIYIIKKGEKIKVEKITGRERVVQLVNQTFTKNILFGQQQSKNFEQCSQLAKTIPMYYLYRPPSLESLPALLEMIKKRVSQN